MWKTPVLTFVLVALFIPVGCKKEKPLCHRLCENLRRCKDEWAHTVTQFVPNDQDKKKIIERLTTIGIENCQSRCEAFWNSTEYTKKRKKELVKCNKESNCKMFVQCLVEVMWADLRI